MILHCVFESSLQMQQASKTMLMAKTKMWHLAANLIHMGLQR
jgi:hypothetical protein